VAKPNVLMIMTDQPHAGCLGYRSHPDVRMPCLDRLAWTGVRFDEAFAQNGLCVPSRVLCRTGMYIHCHGVCGDDLDPIRADLLSPPWPPRAITTFTGWTRTPCAASSSGTAGTCPMGAGSGSTSSKWVAPGLSPRLTGGGNRHGNDQDEEDS